MSSIDMQSLGNIVQCCRCRNVVFVDFYRQDAAKRQTAGIKFTHRPKIRFFTPQGRLVAQIHVKLGKTDGHMAPLGYAKFHLNRHRGGNVAQQYHKFLLFGKESPLWATPLTDFENVKGLLYAQQSCISDSNLT